MTTLKALNTFLICGLFIPSMASAQQTTSAERQAFLEKYFGVATAMGLAYFCGNTSDAESLKGLVVSSAVDSNLHRGKNMYDAVREMMESISAYASGVETGLSASHIVGDDKAAVCREGAEAAARMSSPRKS